LLLQPDDVDKLGRTAGWAGNSMPTTRTMTPPKIERRLAAIMVADVAGYSRLMGTDEVGTLSALKEHRRDRIDPTIARHNGRIFKATGDGLLVEFASVVDAVGCAVAIQRAMLAFNAGIHTDRQIVLRIGINIGDIIVDGDDLFGDGVNVAARLEALCEPGGVCISRSANEQVRNKLSLAFADLGPQTVKNIPQAIGVFGLAARDIATLPEEQVPEGGPWTQDRTSPPVASGIVSMAPRPAPYSPQDRRLSVIVLPFENSSGDPNQDSVAAGITRDVTDRIAEKREVPLVPAVTAAIYRGKTVDVQTIGRDHNVHFALTGNARRQDGHLFVSAVLYETDADRTVWSQRFDRSDSSDAWNHVAQQIANNVNQATIDAEIDRARREHPENLDKRDLILASLSNSLKVQSRQNNLTRIALIERALAIDPDYVSALKQKAHLYADRAVNFASSDPNADLSTALKAADRALQLSPDDVEALGWKGNVLHWQGDLEGAAALIRKAIALAPLAQGGWWYRDLGQIQLQQGHHKEALESFMTLKRLVSETGSSGSQSHPFIDGSVAMGLLANDRFPEAIASAQLAIAQWASQDPGAPAELPWLYLIAAESQDGQDTQARADLQKFLSTPRTVRTIADLRRQKFGYLATIRQLADGLRRAGMPAE
jgi:adenylate cyclase